MLTSETDLLKRSASTTFHTADSNKRKQFSIVHTADSNKRGAYTIFQTTDANKRKVFIAGHLTDTLLRALGNTVHTTNALLAKGLTKLHSTDALLWSMNDPIRHKNSPIFMDIGNGLSTIVGSQKIPSWNSAGRPANPSSGTFGYNFQTNNLEYWNGSNWLATQMTVL